MRSWFLATQFVGLSLSIRLASSFVMPCRQTVALQPLLAWADEYSSSDYSDALARNTARTCVRNFLTQRAIQSFTFLLEDCRDPHTVRWLEQNFDFQNLNRWHGTGAFNLTKYPFWDVMLLDMLTLPKEVVVVSAKRRGRGHGGWSKDNPYLPDRWVEFNIDIDPPSLVSRILSVREQVAREFYKDLDTAMEANDNIISSYFSKQADARQQPNSSGPYNDLDSTDVGITDSRTTGDDYKTPKYRESLVFDRDAMTTFTNSIAMGDSNSSPFRAGNFDLLVLLATQESVHRVLRDYQRDSEREVSFQWFREFFTSKVATHFDGDQSYGRADDFFEELLLSPPKFTEVGDAKKVGLVDPLRIAEDVIRMRATVIQDWKEILEIVPKEHTAIRMAALDLQMGRVVVEPTPTPNSGGQFE